MARFDDPRPAAAEVVEPALQAARQHADQRADDEDAAQGDGEADEPEGPPGVAGDRAGIDGAHGDLPERLRETQRFAVCRFEAREHEDQGADQDQEEGAGEQGADQGDRAP